MVAEDDTSERRGSSRERTCVSCRKSGNPAGLIRWVRGPSGEVVPDLLGKQFGRGAWSHSGPECLKGLARALAKSFKAPILPTDEELLVLLGEAATHRVWQLLGAARRQRLLVAGSTKVREAVAQGRTELVIVARDAQAAARLPEVEAMIRDGKACAWASRDELGKLCGRGEIGVLALLDLRLAQALFGAIAMAPQGSGAAGVPAARPMDSSRF